MKEMGAYLLPVSEGWDRLRMGALSALVLGQKSAAAVGQRSDEETPRFPLRGMRPERIAPPHIVYSL